MGVGGQHHALAALRTGKEPGTRCTGDWVDLGQCGWVRKFSPPL